MNSRLSSRRIVLRAVEPEDAVLMSAAENDECNIDFNGYCAPFSSRQLLEYALSYDADPFRAGQIRMMMTDTESCNTIVIVDLTEISARDSHAFTGIYIFPYHRRRGYAKEALELIASYASATLRINTLGAKIAGDNDASISLFEKAGYAFKGSLEKWTYSPRRKDPVDLLLYQKTI